MRAIKIDGLVKSPIIVMPDPGSSPGRALISLLLAVGPIGPARAGLRPGQARHVLSRGHPEPVEFTVFRRLPLAVGPLGQARAPIRGSPE